MKRLNFTLTEELFAELLTSLHHRDEALMQSLDKQIGRDSPEAIQNITRKRIDNVQEILRIMMNNTKNQA